MDQSQEVANVKNELTDSVLRHRLEMLSELPKSSNKNDGDYLVQSEIDIKAEPVEYESEFQAIAGTSCEICPNYEIKTEMDESIIKVECENFLDNSVEDPLAIDSEYKVAEPKQEHLFQEKLGNEKIPGIKLQKNGRPEYWLTRYNKQIDLELKKKKLDEHKFTSSQHIFSNDQNIKEYYGIHNGQKPVISSIGDDDCTEYKKEVIEEEEEEEVEGLYLLKNDEEIVSSSLIRGKKTYTCPACHKIFKKKSGLDAHLRFHTGEKPFACDICKKLFSHKSHLNDHMHIHTGIKAHVCDVCNKAFTIKQRLNKHKVIHTDVKQFSCSKCNSSYKRKECLILHERIHTGYKPFACDLCEKTFYNTSNLKRHKQAHSGERPFSCNICDKRFAENSDLKRHEETHKK